MAPCPSPQRPHKERLRPPPLPELVAGSPASSEEGSGKAIPHFLPLISRDLVVRLSGSRFCLAGGRSARDVLDLHVDGQFRVGEAGCRICWAARLSGEWTGGDAG